MSSNISQFFDEIKNFYDNASSTLNASKVYRPKIKDPDYGDVYEHLVEYYANRGVHDLSSKEKYALIGIEVLKVIGELSNSRFDDLYFAISYNNGKGGNPSSWSLPEGVEPESVISPTRANEAISEALGLIFNYENKHPNSEFSLRMSGMATTSETFQNNIINSSIFISSPSKNNEKELQLGSLNGSKVLGKTEKSLITIAGPGSGKTQCHVLPNLNSFKGAAIVLDIKGECALNSAKWRKDNVGPVILFAPANSAASKRYNPLTFVSQNPNVVWEDSRLLAELLVVPTALGQGLPTICL